VNNSSCMSGTLNTGSTRPLNGLVNSLNLLKKMKKSPQRALWPREGGIGDEDAIALLRGRNDFRSILEVHRIVVIPLATPDEAVRFEDANDLPGNLVFVSNATADTGL